MLYDDWKLAKIDSLWVANSVDQSLRPPEKATDKTKELFEWPDEVRESLNTKFGNEDQRAHEEGATTAKSPKELAKLDVDQVTEGTNDWRHRKEDEVVKLSGSSPGNIL